MKKSTANWIENVLVELFVKRTETIILTVVGFIPFIVERVIGNSNMILYELTKDFFAIFGLIVFAEIIYISFFKKLKLKSDIDFIYRPEYFSNELWKSDGLFLELINKENEDIEDCFVTLKKLERVDGDLTTNCLIDTCGDFAPRMQISSKTIKKSKNSERLTLCYMGVGKEPVLVFENGRESKSLDKNKDYRMQLSLNGKRKDIDIYEMM